jgi:hypothetical protein
MQAPTSITLHVHTNRPAANDDWSPDAPACAAAALRPAAPAAVARCAA